jgi:translocator protein
MKKYITLFTCLIFPLIIGGLSGMLSADGVSNWYLTLNKPTFNPPSWVFGPVWTTLYLLMGYSFYRIWMQPISKHKIISIRIFFIQLTLNFFWSIIFFRWHETGWATVEIILLWSSILYMIITFSKIDKTAGFLQIPYLLWVTFASFLSGSLWYLNS